MPPERNVLSLPDRHLRELDIEVLRSHEDIKEVIEVHAPFDDGVKKYQSIVVQVQDQYYGLHLDESEETWIMVTEGEDRGTVRAAHESWLHDHTDRQKVE